MENMNTQKSGNGSLSLLLVLLTVAFVVLKLCKIIDWSWWYVTMPLWGFVALGFGIALITKFIRFVYRIFKGN